MKRKIEKELVEQREVMKNCSKKNDDTVEEQLIKEEKKVEVEKEKEVKEEEEEEIEIIECPGVDGARNRNARGMRGFNTRIVR